MMLIFIMVPCGCIGHCFFVWPCRRHKLHKIEKKVRFTCSPLMLLTAYVLFMVASTGRWFHIKLMGSTLLTLSSIQPQEVAERYAGQAVYFQGGFVDTSQVFGARVPNCCSSGGGEPCMCLDATRLLRGAGGGGGGGGGGGAV